MKFEVHISPSFKGGQFFTAFDADNADSVLNALKDAWQRSGMHADTGEAFLAAHADLDGTSKVLTLATVKLYDDGDMFFELNSYDDGVSDHFSEIGYEPNILLSGEDALRSLVDSIL